MRVQLIDVDSRIPNLALMKISAYHKNQGDIVGFDVVDPDLVYSSVIFKKNKSLAVSQRELYRFMYPDAKFTIGGSGYDLHSKLDDEIEYMQPDYTLYTDVCSSCGNVKKHCRCMKETEYTTMQYSVGYTTRGCLRNCYFCVVPEKEGKFSKAQHPEEWHNKDLHKIMFLDNNILLDRDWFFEVTNWCIENDLHVCFNQGLDVRLLDVGIANQLLKMKTWKSVFFAWDHVKDEKVIKEKIELLKMAGFTKTKLKSLVQFYVYVNDDSDYDTGVYRCRELKKLWCNAFVMFNIDKEPTSRIQKLRRWANLKRLYWSMDISEYNRAVA